MQKGVRNRYLDENPAAEPVIDQIFSNKTPAMMLKARGVGLITFYSQEGKIKLFADKNGPVIPHLKIVHAYPFILKRMTVDPPAIPHILNGANCMAPGLLKPESSMEECEKDEVVAIYGAGKQHAIAIGITKMSSAEIRQAGTGMAIEMLHYCGDGIWAMGNEDLQSA